MNKILIFSFFLVMGSFMMAGCSATMVFGSGRVVTEGRPVNAIDKVSFSGSSEMYITQGDEEALKIEAEDNLIPYIKTENENGLLRVYTDRSNFQLIAPTKPVRIYLTVKNLSSLDLSGSGKIIADKLTADRLQMDVNGSGNLKLNQLNTNSLFVRVSGSGKCELNGKATTQEIIISGSGNCNVEGLKSQNVKINVSGSGEAKVRAEETLVASVTGSGDIKYFGHPNVSQTIVGSGKILNQGD